MKDSWTFRENEVGGNPFDVILLTAIEILRGWMFNIIRYRSETEAFFTDQHPFYNRIDEQIKILDSMSDDEVEILRKTSFMFKHINHLTFNDFLFKFHDMIPTAWSGCFVELDSRVEEILLKDDPDEIKERNELRHLADSLVSEYGNEELAIKFIDICINLIDENSDREYPEDEFAKANDFIKLNKFTYERGEYMLSFLWHRILDKTNAPERLISLTDLSNVKLPKK